MELGFGPKYARLREEVAAFLATRRGQAPRGGVGHPSSGRASARRLAWQRLLIARGYAARTIPREYGGFGAPPDPLERIVIDEEFNRAGIARGLSGHGPDMLVPTLLEHGSEAQKRRWIAPTLRGEVVWCQGYSEPGAGSDLAAVQTRGVSDGDQFLVSGQKIWTSNAHHADMMFALVRTEPEASKHRGLSYLLVPMREGGVEVQPLPTMIGKTEFCQVFLEGVRVPAENLVGQRGDGWKIANATLGHERNFLASTAQIEGAFGRLLELARDEEVDGGRLIDDPRVRDRLARLQARTLAMRYHGLRMLTCRLRGEAADIAGMVTKLVGCELSFELAAAAIDALEEVGVLFGGGPYERAPAGGSWPFHHMFSLGLVIGGGTAQIQKNIIAERGLGFPREPRP